jgi:farnesol dehydrogenase
MQSTTQLLVTGATGFIGTRLVQALVDRGHRVRALSRRPQPDRLPGFEGGRDNPLVHPQVELVSGDVTDRGSLASATEGCRRVFHLAGYAKNWAKDAKTFFNVNLQGMRNVFDVAKQLGVERVVWTSTVVTFGPSPPGVIRDEEMPRITQECYTEYEESKLAAEREALRYAERGFPVVIVNPTRVFGPGHLTEGNGVSFLIDQYDRGRAPVLPNRGVNVGNYVFVEDVVRGLLLAMEKGRIGQRYVLGGENVSLRQFLETVDQVSGKRHFKIPLYRAAPLLFSWLQKKRAEWLGVYPVITPGWVRTFLDDWAYSSEKADRELGYQPTPLREGVRLTYQWLQRVREEQT